MQGDLRLKVNEPPRQIRRIAAMKTERRWLKSILTACTDNTPAMPFQRGAKRKPAAFKAVVVKSAAIAAR
jgi:hypothetical protein